MFDSLRGLYEGKNINHNMNLRTRLKNTRMQKGESIQEYFSRISQFKEQLEVIIDDIEEHKLIMTTLNGLTIPWDVFIQTICAITEKLKFDGLWEECIQEETRVDNREALLARDEDQSLATPKEEEISLTSRKKLIKSLTPKTNLVIKNLIQRDSRRKDNKRKEITHMSNATIVIRWNIL
jgi:hypothetical protein